MLCFVALLRWRRAGAPPIMLDGISSSGQLAAPRHAVKRRRRDSRSVSDLHPPARQHICGSVYSNLNTKKALSDWESERGYAPRPGERRRRYRHTRRRRYRHTRRRYRHTRRRRDQDGRDMTDAGVRRPAAAPPRPINAYAIFLKTAYAWTRTKLGKAAPELAVLDEVAREWDLLDTKGRAPYEALAAKDAARYSRATRARPPRTAARGRSRPPQIRSGRARRRPRSRDGASRPRARTRRSRSRRRYRRRSLAPPWTPWFPRRRRRSGSPWTPRCWRPPPRRCLPRRDRA